MSRPEDPACGECPSRRQFLDRVSTSLLLGAMLPAADLGELLADLPISEAAGVEVSPSQHAYPVPASDGVTIDKKEQVILVRYQNKLYAFNLACPHENTALKWRDKDRRFQCPKHESKYTPDGTFTSGRATRNMDRLAVRLEGGQVIVTLDQLFKSDQQPAEWRAAFVQL